MSAGQNQIITINKGLRDGIERGHVLALWRAGTTTVDRTDSSRPVMKLPDERVGTLFVFRTFERVSYALIVSSQDPVKAGDRVIVDGFARLAPDIAVTPVPAEKRTAKPADDPAQKSAEKPAQKPAAPAAR